MENAETQPAAFAHDAAYKAMYGHPEAVAGLRPYLAEPQGPLSWDALGALDFGRVERLPSEWVTEDFLRRHGDQVWRVPVKGVGSRGASTVWAIILLEFQSNADAGMTLRVLGYVWELWRTLEKQGVLAPGAPRPPTLPVVIHNGATPWGAHRRLADWTLAGLPEGLQTGLAPLQPTIGLHVVDFAARRGEDLIPGSLTSLQIGIENAGPSDFERLLPALADLPGAGLRKTAYDWIRRRVRHNFGIELGLLEDEDMSVGVFRSRIDENMKRATEAWYNDGLNDGLNQGRTEGHRLLAQQARTRFGRAAEARLAQALDRGVGPAPAEVADLIVTCDSAEEFAARLDAGAAAGPIPDSEA